MGVNFSSIEIGRRALRANQLGLSVTGQNIANVNTPGYSRQSVQLSASPADLSPNRLVGSGVTIDGVRSFRDRFVESRLQSEKGINGRLNAERDALAPLDVAFNDNEAGGIRSSMSRFFNSFSQLEAQPTSLAARVNVVVQGAELTNAFRSTGSRLSDIRADADNALRQAVGGANNLAQQIAALNARIGVAANTGGGASELQDQRSKLVNQLAELTGARSIENGDGSVSLTLSDGRALVTGDRASRLETVSTPPNGLAAITLDGQPIEITDGRIGGLRNAINFIGEQLNALDNLAASIAERVNTEHASGSDLNGQDGTPFFVSSDGGPFKASNLAVAAAIKADPRLVVAGARGAGSGDATSARNIAALLNDNNSQAGTRAGSFNSIFASLVTDAGARISSADNALATQSLILSQTEAQRESISGVSLDEEAINLLQYQKAYEAAARFLRIADEMTQTILSLGQ